MTRFRCHWLMALTFFFGGSGTATGQNSCPPSAIEYSSNQSCTFMPGTCPHRGGDRIHNECADRVPPNVVWSGVIGGTPNKPGEGCDVSYGGFEFDALSWDSRRKNPRVWEIKTANWSGYDAFPKQCELRDDIKTFIDHCTAVIRCNQGIRDPEQKVKYILAIADPGLYHAVNEYFAKNPGKLPAGAAETCSTLNVQGCRR